jgi:hypothetical protein
MEPTRFQLTLIGKDKNVPTPVVAIHRESLLLGYYNRFQHGEFAKHRDLHGGAGVDGPVIARYSLGHLSVNRGRDFPAQ